MFYNQSVNKHIYDPIPNMFIVRSETFISIHIWNWLVYRAVILRASLTFQGQYLYTGSL